MKKCKTCNKEIDNKNTYCSRKCHRCFERNIYIISWLNGNEDGKNGNGVSTYIKRYLFELNNNSCQICGWNKINNHNKVPLEVHHVDGNHTNNECINLQLLCPNCHALTNNYKARNKSSRTR